MTRTRAVRLAVLSLLGALFTVACGSHSITAKADTNASVSSSASASIPATGTSLTGAGAGLHSDWPQFGDGTAHTGTGPASPGITAANARSLSLRRVTVDGIVDSAAIELSGVTVKGRRHDLLAVTTTYGKTIAIDPGTGAMLWEFRPRGVNGAPGNPQVTTASPAADPDRAYIYSASPNGFIHKLVAATGHEVWARRITFDAHHEKIASALTVTGRYVVAVTGGYIGDAPPYDGHVVTIDRTSGRIAHVWNSECSARHRLIRAASCPVTDTQGDNAIWGRPGAVVEPGSGRILVATGNGPFDGRSSWGDSVLELAPDASRLLHNWTPMNQAALDAGDTDLGSTSPAVLPDYHGFRLAVQAGKDAKLHLLDLGRLNGTRGRAGRRLGGELQEADGPGGDIFAQPAVWSHGGRIYVFAATASGTEGYLLGGGARPRLHPLGVEQPGGTSPVIAGGLLYVYDMSGGHMVIRRPTSGAVVRSLDAGKGHWNSPIVVGGRIVEPTDTYFDSATSSTIDIWHLPGR